ncbi:uncharacterized protein LOC135949685 [Calliphora vicina]|uniref:uncharacterized protein LOC135949685 n=1 Tax=Calliphora vicina TaxID=7373 RepID=UPI00325C2F29
MSALGDFVDIKHNVANAKRMAIVAMHKLIFEEDGDRGNRQRVRQFTGFDFKEHDVEYEQKRKYVEENLSDADLVAVCNVLGLGYNKDDLFQHIFSNMKKGQLMCCLDNDDYDDDDDVNDDNDATIVQNDAIINNDDDDVNNDDDGTIVHNDANNNNNDGDHKNIEHDDASNNSYENKYVGRAEFNDGSKSKTMQSMARSTDDGNGMQNAEFVNVRKSTCMNMQRFAINYRDIEDSIPSFDGDGNMPIDVWIDEFEETSSIMGFDDFQMFIFAKKSLKGLAKLYVSSERGITSYAILKKALRNEFGSTVNSAQLHRMMIQRRMNGDETIHQYFFSMKELASRGSIDDSTLMEYVIDGINDLTVNKSILYGATNLKDFKIKLKCYETMVDKSTKPKMEKPTTSRVKNDRKEKTCFNCGGKGHESKYCKDKDKGVKCFSCNKFGHVSKQCPTKQEKANVRQLVTVKKNPMEFEVQFLCDQPFSAKTLFDTGSKFNVVSNDVYERLKSPKLGKSDFYLVGFGNQGNQNKIKPIGNFEQNINIDDDEYILTFHVVPTDSIDVDVILGNEFCKFSEINITSDGLKIRKVLNETVEEIHKMMVINTYEDPDNEVSKGEIDDSASENAKLEVRRLITNYRPVKTKTTNVEMKIIVKDETPIHCSPRRLPITERKIVDDQIEEWLKEGIFEPSESEYSSPVVLVKKRNGEPRLCVDFRRINKVIEKDRFPLPLIEDQLDRLQDTNIFSTIDLKNGFFHVSVEE